MQHVGGLHSWDAALQMKLYRLSAACCSWVVANGGLAQSCSFWKSPVKATHSTLVGTHVLTLPSSLWHHIHIHVPGLFKPTDDQPKLKTQRPLSCAGDSLPPGKPDFSQRQQSTSLVAQQQTGIAQSSKSSGPADVSNAALGSLPIAETAAAAGAGPTPRAASQQTGVTPAQVPLLAEAGASQTDRSAGLNTAGVSSPGVAAMPVRTSQARKPLKPLSAVTTGCNAAALAADSKQYGVRQPHTGVPC